MPFVWGTLAKQGQIYGNRDKAMRVAYQRFEVLLSRLSGDPLRLSRPTDQKQRRPAKSERNRVGMAPRQASLPRPCGGLCRVGCLRPNFQPRPVRVSRHAGFSPLAVGTTLPQVELLNRLKREIPRQWDDEPADALTFYTALEYFKVARPRVFYLSLGDTDDWAHAGRYDEYLTAAHRADGLCANALGNRAVDASIPGNDNAHLLHGSRSRRGAVGWRDHGEKVNGAEFIWVGFLGPDTPALGERANAAAVTQGQVAATLAALLGEDYRPPSPRPPSRSPKSLASDRVAALGLFRPALTDPALKFGDGHAMPGRLGSEINRLDDAHEVLSRGWWNKVIVLKFTEYLQGDEN